jgi:hypothetical protein
MGFFTLWKTPKRFFKNPSGGFHTVKNHIGLHDWVGEKPLKNPISSQCGSPDLWIRRDSPTHDPLFESSTS